MKNKIKRKKQENTKQLYSTRIDDGRTDGKNMDPPNFVKVRKKPKLKLLVV